MKKTTLIVLILVLTGCGSSLKNSWSNFTAYYNTFYNAKQDFNEGLARVSDQPVQLNADIPVKAHPTPVLAGSEHFESAIDNAAQVLRRFPHSKWTDDALLLMGKSYYYLQEYFLARQKFEEILDLPSQTPLKQQAVIWKARTLLDIGSFGEGIQFLRNQLDNFQGRWESDNKAEARVLLAEHLAMLGNWSEAATILEEAIPELDKEPLKGRSYLLWGQMLEKNNELIKAFQVYSNVKRYFLDYEYVYRAEMKQARVSRMGERTELAISIYSNMLRDDKSFERRNEIYYQLAQTYEEQGNYPQAEDTYKYILENSDKSSDRQFLANVYYQLGQLYSDEYSSYTLAAAYFDSSSSLSVQAMPGSGEAAGKMASAYNRYLSLKEEIAHADSLLKLADLSEQELQEQLVAIRQQRREAMQESQNIVQQTRNTLANTGVSNEISQTAGSNVEPSAYGFLNYRNEELLQQGRRQFTAVWGQRPLVDDWRRREAILSKNVSDLSTSLSPNESGEAEAETFDDQTLGININEIPRTEEAKEQLRYNRLNAFYRLGSLFFLTLNQPDSASKYYRRILEQSPSEELEAQTLYSLYELYRLEQQPDSTQFYRERILQSYPDTKYAAQISENDTEGNIKPVGKDSTAVLRERVQKVLTESGEDVPSVKNAEKLRKIAVNDQSSPLAAAIFYEAIREYIQYAHHRDSVAAATDTLTKEAAAPYTGDHWEQVESLIMEFKQLFPNAKQVEHVNTWLNFLRKPHNVLPAPTCEELDAEPKIVQGKTAFVESISLPEKVSRMNISGSIQYRLTITKQGKVEEAELLSNPTALGIEEAYKEAIMNRLQFAPLIHNGEAVRANCEVEFPINQ